MSGKPQTDGGTIIFSEMKEFASFPKQDQYYISRSLDVFNKNASIQIIAQQFCADVAILTEQKKLYKNLTTIQNNIPYEGNLFSLEDFIEPLIITSTFDVAQKNLSSFNSYRFLYERLLGGEIRPWLVPAFCTAAAMPTLAPTLRKSLLQSISEAAATAPGWSERKPIFFPSFVSLDL